MSGDYIEIRYSSPKTGFVTETVAAQTTQGAINLIRSRVPDANINWIKFHNAPQPDQRNDQGGSTRSR
jgi:hypothetical protein